MRHLRFAVLVPLLLTGCAEKPQTLLAPDDLALQMILWNMSPWTEATDAPFVGVNTPVATEGCPFVTRSEHALVFASNRAGGHGALDLYISYWDAAAKQWGTPVNLGPKINTAANEQCPLLSQNGKELIFVSNRPGGAGGLDLWVAHRHDNRSDLEWETAVNLATVNSLVDEFGPGWYEENGRTVLYFNSNRAGGAGGHDLYVSHQTSDGTFAAPVPAAGLNTQFQEQFASLSKDGLEIFFSSDRPGTLGGLDLWHATGERTSDPWGTPANLGPAVNSLAAEGRSAISWDGMTLYFHATRKGSVDLFQTTRTPSSGWRN
jgi:Tol biopolymer transport system component